MNFTEYQLEAMKTAIWITDPDGLAIPPEVYCALKLNGEAGEVAEKIGKVYRDNGGEYDDYRIDGLALEIGDVLWYLAGLCETLGLDLGYIANLNINKLRSRRERNVIKGDGDDR